MNLPRNALALGIVIGAGGAIALAVVLGLAVMYGGLYNIAASEAHGALTRWVFTTTMQRSVRQHAADTGAPPAVTASLLAHGAREYRSMCQHCHGGPGTEREKWADGMRPQPPRLVDAAPHWQRQEVFWLVKHGVKMSGMPSFGPSHDDRTLWSIAAFVKELPAMSVQRYETLSATAGDEDPDAHAHGE